MSGKLIFDDKFDVEYINAPMWDQLGKIQDSESAREVVKPAKFKAVNTVLTDDGVKITVTPEECQKIKDVLLQLRPPYRPTVLRKLQTSLGLNNMLRLIR
jgi:hypothetical protein|tara:strand:+ start:3905 stop:4204 length:300 start_codon:yes stop_codon:yes gene_type:complete